MSDDQAQQQSNIKRVQLALALTGTFMLVEVVGGILSGSLALLADAGHMLTDTMALALSAIAFRMSARPADKKRSYGYQRFQILAAFVNGLSLLLIVGWILFEAVQRILNPPLVMGQLMLIVAAAGLVVNIIVFIVIHGGDQENLNMRGAALHVLVDHPVYGMDADRPDSVHRRGGADIQKRLAPRQTKRTHTAGRCAGMAGRR